MTMPMGASGIEPDAWMQNWTVTGSPNALLSGLSNLHERTRTNVEESLYSTNIDQNQDWTDIFDWFLNLAEGLIAALPEWLAPLKTVLEWVGTFFTENMRGTFATLGAFFAWLTENITNPLTEGVTGIIKWIWDAFTGTANRLNTTATAILQGIFGFLNWLWAGTGIEGAFVGFAQSIDSVLKPLLEWLHDLWVKFGDAVDDFLNPIFDFLDWLWRGVAGGFAGLGNSVATVLKPIVEWLTWLFGGLWDGLPAPTFSGTPIISNFLNPVVNWLKWLFGVFTPNALQEVFGTIKALVNSAGSMAQWVANLPGVNDILQVVQSLTGTISNTLTQAVSGLVSWAQNIPGLGTLIQSILGGWKNPVTGTNTTLTDLIAWSGRQLTTETVVPSWNLVGDIPQELIAMLPIGHIGDAQPNLVTDQGFASDAALQSGQGWSWDGTVSSAGSGGGSAKMVGDGSKKLLFSNLVQVAPGQKLTLSAKVKWTKTLGTPSLSIGVRGYTGALVKFTSDVGKITTNATANASTNSGTFTTAIAGTTATYADGWVTISGNFTVPQTIVENGITQAGIDSIRMYVGSANTVSGFTAWFDDAVMKKTSLLPQDLVSELTADLGAKLPDTDFRQLLNTIANQTGATMAEVEAALAEYLTSGSDLNGSNIKYGNIQSAFISELTATWSKIYFGISNGSNAASQELAKLKEKLDLGTISISQYQTGVTEVLNKYPTAGLQDFATSMANQGSLIQSNISKILGLSSTTSDLGTRAGLIESALRELQGLFKLMQTATGELQGKMTTAQEDIKALQIKTSSTVTPTTPPTAPTGSNPSAPVPTTPTGPTKVSTEDTFDRVATSIGSNWILAATRNPDGSTLTCDGNNAVVVPPTFSDKYPQWAAVWNGSNSSSITKFQRVYATIGGAGGVPLAGTVGYNDLIARAASGNPLVGIVARFYADGSVRLFARTGAWENAQYSPAVYPGSGVEATAWWAPFRPTTGTTIELLAGVSGDESKFVAKMGTWTSPVVTMPGNVMSLLGNGWGMGFGNGWALSLVPTLNTPQPAGSYNIWGASDQ